MFIIFFSVKSKLLFFQGSISNPGDGIAIARAVVNTALGTSAAGLCTLIFNKTGIVPGSGQYYSFLVTMNGSLTGRALFFQPSGALIIKRFMVIIAALSQ